LVFTFFLSFNFWLLKTRVFNVSALYHLKVTGLNVGLVLQTACQDTNIDPEIREKTIDILTRHIDEALQYQRDYGAKNKSVFLFSLLNIGLFFVVGDFKALFLVMTRSQFLDIF
jgi:hypothetical protein